MKLSFVNLTRTRWNLIIIITSKLLRTNKELLKNNHTNKFWNLKFLTFQIKELLHIQNLHIIRKSAKILAGWSVEIYATNNLRMCLLLNLVRNYHQQQMMPIYQQWWEIAALIHIIIKEDNQMEECLAIIELIIPVIICKVLIRNLEL